MKIRTYSLNISCECTPWSLDPTTHNADPSGVDVQGSPHHREGHSKTKTYTQVSIQFFSIHLVKPLPLKSSDHYKWKSFPTYTGQHVGAGLSQEPSYVNSLPTPCEDVRENDNSGHEGEDGQQGGVVLGVVVLGVGDRVV